MFILKYIRGTGIAYSREPFESKMMAAVEVLRVFPAQNFSLSITEAKGVGRQVLSAPIGERVTHEPSGITFWIEGD